MLEIIDYKILKTSNADTITAEVNRLIKQQGWQPLGPAQVVVSGTSNNYFSFIQTLVKYKQSQIKELS